MTDDAIASVAPVAPDAPVQPTPETEPTAPPPAPEPEADPDLAALPDEKVRTGLQKRFKELTDKNKNYEQQVNDAVRLRYEVEAKVADYERKFQAMQKPVDTAEIGPMPEPPTLPSLDDPNIKTIEQYNEAIAKYKKDLAEFGPKLQEWSGKKSIAEFGQRQKVEQQQRQQMEEATKMAAKGRAAMQKYPDFQATVQPFLGLADQIPELQLFIRDSDTGTDLLYHLSKNPALLDGLARMTSPVQRARELLRLEGAITAPPVKTQTKAPEPITPVGGGDGNVTKLIDLAKKDDVSEYIARSNREALRKRKGN